MKKDKFFKFAFFLTVIFMAGVFSTNIERRIVSRPIAYREARDKEGKIERVSAAIFEKVDIERIRKLIKEDKLSDREAMFYRAVESE